MSIAGILGSNFFAAAIGQTAQNTQTTPNTQSGQTTQTSQNLQAKFQTLQTEFQQLNQDLQAGNLTQAQTDYATLAQNLPAAAQNGNSAAYNAFTQLGQDLQNGNLTAAQQDFANVQSDAQQSATQQTGFHHHHHRAESQQNANGTNNANSNSTSQTNGIVQAFSTLAQALQSGNLTGAQTAFATLQSDLQQIGGFVPNTLTGGTAAASGTSAAAGTLNVSA